MINIKNKSGKQIRYTTPINEGCVWKKELMKHDYVLLKFSTQNLIDFQNGDYIETSFGKYEMIEKVFPTFNKSTGGYDYELTFQALQYKWKNHILLYDRGANKEASWSLTATPDVHLQRIIVNLDALGYKCSGQPYTFSIDNSIDQSAKFLSYGNVNILDALTMIAEAWEAEWWIEGSKINIGRCEYNSSVDFALHENVSSMSRSSSNDNFATRIYAFGSTRNLPSNYRSSSENIVVNGVVQKRLMLPGDKNCVDAYENLAPEDVVESVVVFDDVYPRRIGTISSISTKEYVDTIENEDKTTTQEKWKAYRFKDSGIRFSEKYVIPGEEIRIAFTSGKLNGMDFAVAFNPHTEDEPALPEKNPNGTWNDAAQVYEIIRNEDYGVPLPNEIYKPIEGDNYILYGFDISLVSDTYVGLAEKELEDRAKDYVEKSKEDPSVYDCTMNMISLTENDIDMNVGDRVRLLNPTYFDENGRDSRIYGFEKHLDGSQATYTVGNTAKYSRLAKVENEVKEIVYDGNTYSGGGSGVYVIGKYDSTSASDRNVFSARRSMIEFLSTKYPSTAQRTVTFKEGIELGDYVPGAKGASIYQDEQGSWHVDTDFINIRKKLTAEELEIQKTTHIGGKVMNTAGSMTCSDVQENDTYWRCYFNQKDESGREVKRQFEIDDLAYVQTFNLMENEDGTKSNHFLWRLVMGVGDNYIDLSKEDCCNGSDAPLVGDIIVQLGNKTDARRQGAIIQASVGEGAPYIRVYKGINSYSYPKPKIDLNPEESSISAHSITLESTGENIQDTLQQLAGNVDKVKEQNDGMWVLWFGADIPTLENFPASDWETDELKAEHVQDILVIDNKNDEENNGKAYRFIQADNGSFEWNEITDQYLLKALDTANKSKEIAQEKRRNFIEKPEDWHEYAPGDTWANAYYDDGVTKYVNDNLVATTYKPVGKAFNIHNWQPVSLASSAKISVLEKEINLRVSEHSFNELGERVVQAESTIKQLPDEISLAVKNIQVGARNLAVGTKDIEPFYVRSSMPGTILQNEGLFRNLTNGEYTISFDAKLIAGTGNIHVEFWGSQGENVLIDSSDWKRYSLKSTFTNTNKSMYFWINHISTEVLVKDLKIESGNKATDWTPAPEDQPTNKELLATGIDITNKQIVMTADNTSIQSNGGEQIALFTTINGKPVVKAENIDTDNLTARKVETAINGQRIVLDPESGSILMYDEKNRETVNLNYEINNLTPNLYFTSYDSNGGISHKMTMKSSGIWFDSPQGRCNFSPGLGMSLYLPNSLVSSFTVGFDYQNNLVLRANLPNKQNANYGCLYNDNGTVKIRLN